MIVHPFTGWRTAEGWIGIEFFIGREGGVGVVVEVNHLDWLIGGIDEIEE